jgi:hypothetical protein
MTGQLSQDRRQKQGIGFAGQDYIIGEKVSHDRSQRQETGRDKRLLLDRRQGHGPEMAEQDHWTVGAIKLSQDTGRDRLQKWLKDHMNGQKVVTE